MISFDDKGHWICKDAPYEEILKYDAPDEEFSGNAYKSWREAWLVATFCKLSDTKGLVTAPYGVEPVDAILQSDVDTYYFQCVEAKNGGSRGRPTDLKHEVDPDGTIFFPLIKYPPSYVHNSIKSGIFSKNSKYSADCYRDLILLVYQNFTFPTKEDVNYERLVIECQNMNFKSIYMLDGSENIYLLGGENIFRSSAITLPDSWRA